MAQVAELTSQARGERPPRRARMFVRLSRRGLPPPACGVTVERSVRVPAADGAILLADHYWPLTGAPAPTVLVRCPYGRGFPWDWMYGALFAGQGFHVLLQSCRGTGGSDGTFEPFVNEAADGQAAVAWLRGQDWFNGSLGTIGASYLGFTQWALAADPPPELRAMVVQVSSDDFYRFLYPGGALALEAALTGITAMASMHRGFGAFTRAMLRLLRHRRRAGRSLPLIDSYPAAAGGRIGWFEEWLAHPSPADPFWNDRRASPDVASAPPVSLLGGWSDVCIDPTLDLYRRLRAAGREVRLTVGPWNHTSGFNDDMPILAGEAIDWFRAHLSGSGGGDASRGTESRGHPVRVWTGAIGEPGEWRDMADWPPPGMTHVRWHLHGDGTMTAADGAGSTTGSAGSAGRPGEQAVTSFRYDPASPTPSVGGPSMDSRVAGPRRNDALEARDDVVTFTSAPLGDPLELAGPVSVRLRVRGSTPSFDVFARLCDVDARGRSWNVCDGLLRLGDSAGWTEITVPMSSAAHRFGAGHRLRVQLSGGAHPRFMRNAGTGEPIATATRLGPADIEISHDASRPCTLSLPAMPRAAGPL